MIDRKKFSSARFWMAILTTLFASALVITLVVLLIIISDEISQAITLAMAYINVWIMISNDYFRKARPHENTLITSGKGSSDGSH